MSEIMPKWMLPRWKVFLKMFVVDFVLLGVAVVVATLMTMLFSVSWDLISCPLTVFYFVMSFSVAWFVLRFFDHGYSDELVVGFVVHYGFFNIFVAFSALVLLFDITAVVPCFTVGLSYLKQLIVDPVFYIGNPLTLIIWIFIFKYFSDE